MKTFTRLRAVIIGLLFQVAFVVTLQAQHYTAEIMEDEESGCQYAAVTKYLANGEVDNSYGENGVSEHARMGKIAGYHVLDDGRVVVVGTTDNYCYDDFHTDLVMYGFTPTGAIDPTFGTHGKTIFSISPYTYESIQYINFQPNYFVVFGVGVSPGTGYASYFLNICSYDGGITTYTPFYGYVDYREVNGYDPDHYQYNITVSGNKVTVTSHIYIEPQDQDVEPYTLDDVTVYQVGPDTQLQCPSDIMVYTDKGICSAIVNNIDPVNASDVTYSISGAESVSGAGSLSGHAFQKGTSMVTYRLNSDDQSCTFSVMVRDSAVSVHLPLGSKTLCAGSDYSVTADTAGLSSSYQWYRNNVSLGEAQQTPTLMLTHVSATNAGQYKLVVKGNCNSDTSNVLNVQVASPFSVSIPNAVTLASSNKNCQLNTVYKGYLDIANRAYLAAMVKGGKAPYKYMWSTGGNQSAVTVMPSSTTTYSVTVTDAAGCTATASRQVSVVNIACGNNKVTVCHQGTTLCIPSSQVADHIYHGDCFGPCPNFSKAIVRDDVLDNDDDGLTLTASPNPAASFFNVKVSSTKLQVPVVIKITDITGRIVEVRNVTASSVFSLGSNYRPGVYIVQAVQGKNTRVLKLIRQ